MYTSQYIFDRLITAFEKGIVENWPYLMLTLALVAATIALAIYTAKLWKTTEKYTTETKKANNINLLSNVLNIKSEIEVIYLNRFKSITYKMLDDVLSDKLDLEEGKKELIKISKENSESYSLCGLIFKVIFEQILKNLMQTEKYNTTIFDYIFLDSIATQTAINSKCLTLLIHAKNKNEILNFQISNMETILDEIKGKLKIDSSYENNLYYFQQLNQLLEFKLLKTKIRDDTISILNGFFSK